MRKHFWGGVISLLIMIAGLWLMQAPFAFGYQPGGATWTASTDWDFWLGLGIAAVSLVGVALFVQSALAELRRLGVIQPRPSRPPAPAPATTPAFAGPTSATTTADLERVLLPMATALLADIAERRNANAAGTQPGTSKRNGTDTAPVTPYTAPAEGKV